MNATTLPQTALSRVQEEVSARQALTFDRPLARRECISTAADAMDSAIRTSDERTRDELLIRAAAYAVLAVERGET